MELFTARMCIVMWEGGYRNQPPTAAEAPHCEAIAIFGPMNLSIAEFFGFASNLPPRASNGRRPLSVGKKIKKRSTLYPRFKRNYIFNNSNAYSIFESSGIPTFYPLKILLDRQGHSV